LLWEREVDHHIPPGRNIRVFLPDVVVGVDQRFNGETRGFASPVMALSVKVNRASTLYPSAVHVST